MGMASGLKRLGAIGLCAIGLAACSGTGGGGGDVLAPARGALAAMFPPPRAEPPVNDPRTGVPSVAVRCPPVDVREGTETLRTFEQGGAGDQNRLRWQATIAETARECRSYANEVNYVVGLAGRVVLGPQGAPGTFTVPVRIALTRGDDQNRQVIFTRLQQVQVTVPPGAGQGSFAVVVDDIRVPRQPTDYLADVQLLVGFDPAPPQPERRRPARRRTS
jgi:hypothetical protein